MQEDILSFVGMVVVTAISVTGAWIWLRWGWTGVALLWARRREIDRAVAEDMDQALKGIEAHRE